ncbi:MULTISPECIES: hypothetical protein [Leptolyngbya]|uniref:hypothetical protein n=1 Tax=Leptolyngbya TaxID=47251 RepID=UPI0016858FC0|nr:hypothetical protein [Leptolyngbya sp. FACHB-1624]MBD1855538.1 hypothetical protein [Leptolyngbya sp. FACHB-1624]
MAHYITEQIAIAETTTGNEKSEAEQRCFETILKLWERRSSLPNGRYPFKSFESIFKALNRLDPENTQPYYFDDSRPQANVNKGNEETESETDKVQTWVNIALGVDRAARVLIDFALREAACNAVDEETIAWLENATGISDDKNDVSIVIRLVRESQEDNAEEEVREQKRRELSSRIEKLNMLMELSGLLRDELTEHLENISDGDFSTDS